VARAHGHAPPDRFPRPAPEVQPGERDRERAASADVGRDHGEMLRRWIWRDFANITLGVWLIASPFTLGYRDAAMVWNDLASGIIIVTLGVLTLWPRFDLLRWALCFSGIWLLFAPLVFWTRDAGAYANDTLVGSLLIAFSVLIPMMPSHAHHEVMMTPGPDTPPGWSYNPSDWLQRGPIIAMAFVGFFRPGIWLLTSWDTSRTHGIRSLATGHDASWIPRSRRPGRFQTPASARCRTCWRRSPA
jgi:hypothetical protein